MTTIRNVAFIGYLSTLGYKQTSKFDELPEDIKDTIYDKALPTISCVDRLCAAKYRNVSNNAANKIQRWYRSRKLEPGLYEIPQYLTRNTQIRYYLVKYKIEWLKNLPRKMIRKCGVAIEQEDERFNNELPLESLISEVRYFLTKYATMDVMMYYGW